MKTTFYALVFALLALSVSAQECGTGRYTDVNYFAETTMSTVEFGANTAVAGGNQILRMDVYEPVGDVLTNRPVVVVTFGGSFIGGTRADVADLCIAFAKLGYVSIASDYRVGFFLPNGLTTTRAVMRGTHDMKAVVRYLRKSVAEDNNPFKIDEDRIIIGGVSAGAISALHAVYLDQPSEIPTVLAGEIDALGGVEGNSGSPGYSSAVMGCWSMSGAIADTSYIIPGDTPLASIHEVGDGVVPYGTQEVAVVGIATGLIASGSHDIHERMNNIDATNCFLSYPGSGHVGYLNYDQVGSFGFLAQFFADLVCNNTPSCGELPTGISYNSASPTLSVFPNPTAGTVQLSVPISAVVRVLDAQGRVLFTQLGANGLSTLELGSYADGIYTIQVSGASAGTVRVVKIN